MKLLVNEVKLKGWWASKQDSLRAQKVSRSFEKRAPDPDHPKGMHP